MSEPEPVLFSYCLDFGEREFTIDVTRDGVIHWDDYMQRRRQRPEEDKYLEIETIVGSSRARKRLASEIENYTINFPLPEQAFSRIEVAAQMFDAGLWTTDHEKQLDELLIPLFWEHVNPYLEPPLKRPNHAMQPTTDRRTPKLPMTQTTSPAATRALASGG